MTFGKPDIFAERLPARKKIIFGCLVFGFIVVFAVGMGFIISVDHRRTVIEAKSDLSHIAEFIKKNLESSLSIANIQMWHVIDQISQETVGSATWDPAAYDALLKDTVERVEQIDSLVLIDPEGIVVWSTIDVLVGQNLADRLYFKRAKGLGRLEYAVGVPIISRATGRRVTPIAWPVLSKNGILRGVAASSLGDKYFENLISSTNLRDTMIVEIVTEDGEIAFTSAGDERDMEVSWVSVFKELSALGLNVTVSRSRNSVFSGFNNRTVTFLLITITLFASALGLAGSSQLKSFKISNALKRAKQDTIRILTAQREFEAIYQNVADGIVIFAQNGNICRSNRKARDLLVADKDEDAVHVLKELLPSISDLKSDLTVCKLKMPSTNNENDTQHIQARVMKLYQNDQTVIYCVLSDVSAEERLSSAREGFVTSVNHELRTPLTSLAGSLDLLENRYGGGLPTGAQKLVGMATRNAERLLVLVNDILTLQAIDQGHLRINIEEISVAEALEEAVSANAGYGTGARVRLSLQPPAIEGYLMADKVRLQQIFSNIISNAIKYSPKSGEVTIGADFYEGSVSFWVRDSGPGIPESTHGRLFERFAAPVHSRGVQATGTGLGLAITKKLIEQQGGEISFVTRSIKEDPDNSGTTFFVKFDIRLTKKETKGIAS